MVETRATLNLVQLSNSRLRVRASLPRDRSSRFRVLLRCSSSLPVQLQLRLRRRTLRSPFRARRRYRRSLLLLLQTRLRLPEAVADPVEVVVAALASPHLSLARRWNRSHHRVAEAVGAEVAVVVVAEAVRYRILTVCPMVSWNP